MEIVWLPQARRHVDEIGLFIAKNSAVQADRVCGMIEQAPEVLRLYPEFGAVVPEYDNERIRELRVFQYRIIYRIRGENEAIEILAVYHGARQLPGD